MMSLESGIFRKKTKWISGIVTFPILVFLILTIITPIFERTIDRVVPMLMLAFGYITVPDLPSTIQEQMTFGNMFSFLAQQEGNAIYILIVTVAFFCLAAPIFRSIVLDLMWILPFSMSTDSNNDGLTIVLPQQLSIAERPMQSFLPVASAASLMHWRFGYLQ